MRRFAIACVGALVAAVVCAFAGYWLVEMASSNTHDRSMEAAMTGIFVFGPLGAIAGFVAGLIIGRRPRAATVVTDTHTPG